MGSLLKEINSKDFDLNTSLFTWNLNNFSMKY